MIKTSTEIQNVIKTLSGDELRLLRSWLNENLWDLQIEKDVSDGKFDDLIREAESQFEHNDLINLC